MQRASYLSKKLAALPGVKLLSDGPFFKEFVIRTEKDAARLLAEVGPNPWTARNAASAARGEPFPQQET